MNYCGVIDYLFLFFFLLFFLLLLLLVRAAARLGCCLGISGQPVNQMGWNVHSYLALCWVMVWKAGKQLPCKFASLC